MDDSIEGGPAMAGADQSAAARPDAQLAELIESEAAARREDRVEAAVKYRG